MPRKPKWTDEQIWFDVYKNALFREKSFISSSYLAPYFDGLTTDRHLDTGKNDPHIFKLVLVGANFFLDIYFCVFTLHIIIVPFIHEN